MYGAVPDGVGSRGKLSGDVVTAELDEKPYKLPWLRYLVVYGWDPPALTTRQWLYLFLCGSCAFWSSYDSAILRTSLVQIQGSLHIPDDQISHLASCIQFGQLAGLPIMLAADLVGRRTILLLSVVPFSVFTGVTAFAHSATYFVTFQFLSRMFTCVVDILTRVAIVEEMPTHCRGWAVGALMAMSTTGGGFSLMLFAMMGDHLVMWRYLCLIAFTQLGLVVVLRAKLSETARFVASAAAAAKQPKPPAAAKQVAAGAIFASHCRWLRTQLEPLQRLFTHNTGQAVAVFAVSFVYHLGTSAAALYDFKYLQQVHSFTPVKIYMLGSAGGAFGLAINATAGSMSDRLGRRRFVAAALLANSCLLVSYYLIPAGAASKYLVYLVWGLKTASGLCVEAMLAALFIEIFPTSHRSTAQNLVLVSASLGSPSGLFAEGLLSSLRVVGDHWRATSALNVLQVLCAAVVACCLPETAGRELEDISGAADEGGRQKCDATRAIESGARDAES